MRHRTGWAAVAVALGACGAPSPATPAPTAASPATTTVPASGPPSTGATVPPTAALPVTTPTPSVPPRYAFVPGGGRTAPPRTAGCPDGTRAPVLLALLATGPRDTRERVRLHDLALCPGALRVLRARSDATWVRTAAPETYVTVERGPDLSDVAILHRDGKRSRLDPGGGYSTQIPDIGADGSVAYAAISGERHRLVLSRPRRAPVTLGESPTGIDGIAYSPTGARLFVLEPAGRPPAQTDSTLRVVDASGERAMRTGRPRAAFLHALDETRVVIGDVAETPADSSVVVDTATGRRTPLRPGLFAVAYDARTGRLLVRDVADWSLAWLSGPAFATETRLGGVDGARVVGGDWLR